MTTRLDPFESRLLAALREDVRERTAPVAGPRRRPRRPVLAGLAAGIAAATVILVPGLGSETAYSVQEGNSGRVEVQVNRFEDAAGLERALAGHGITAQVTYVPDGGTCVPGRYHAVHRRGVGLTVGADLFRVTLEPGTVRDGETLVIDASLVELPDTVDPETGVVSTDGFQVTVDAEVARGPVPACSPVPASSPSRQ